MTEAYYKSLEPFFGSWHIKEFIGRGSYGQVYKIEKEDISGSYTSAMKIISIINDPDAASFSGGMTQQNLDEYYSDLIKNIVKEFKMMEKLKGNTNVVCYEDHEIRKKPDGKGYDIFIRMEQLTPITKHFGSAFPGEDEVIKLGIDMCRALELCHKNNIIHRDVKPQNIFISQTGDYKLGDFGVARNFENTVGEFSAKGTFDYMAPEVQLRQPYGVGADIFSLGAVLYKLMNNGRIAFLPDYPDTVKSADYERALERRMNGEIPKKPVCASNAFANVIIKALSFDPAERYESAEQMRKALEQASSIIDGNKNLQYIDYVLSENGEGFIVKGTGFAGAKPKESPKVDPKPKASQPSAPTRVVPIQKPAQKAIPTPDPISETQKTRIAPAIVQNVQGKAADTTPNVSYHSINAPSQSISEILKEESLQEKAMTPKKQKLFIGLTIATIILVILIIVAGVGVVIAKNPALHDKLQAILPFDISFLKPDTSVHVGNISDTTDDLPDNREWKIDSYEEKYPFYAIERLYNDGEETNEYRVNKDVTKYTEEEARIFYSIDFDTGIATRTLYLNGEPTDYVETVTAMEKDEWVIEGYETDSFREYARRYVDGAMTDETCYTGRTFESEYYVSIENGEMSRLLYVDKKPVSSSPITELEAEEWVLEGFEIDTYRQYARKYVNGNPTDETKLTGLVYKAEDYYFYDKDSDMYYLITYVNGIAMNDTKRGYISSIAGLDSAWVVSEYYEVSTYNEYAERYVYGVNTGEVRYTGAKKQIVEWIIEGYSNISPYYQYERKYVNGEKTYETRYTTPRKTDPNRASKQPATSTTTTPTTPETPTQNTETPAQTETPTQPQQELKYYMNPDGSINFSELRVEYWYDAYDREYKIWYDRDGNEVIRFATGAYKVRRNSKK